MPLIRAMGRWMARRNEVTEPYVPNRPMGYGGDPAVAMAIWLVFVILALPLLACLVLTGLVYEGVIRLDRRSWLNTPMSWIVSGAVATAAVVLVVALLVRLV